MTNEQAIAELQKEHDLIQSEHDLDGSQFAPALLEALAMAIDVIDSFNVFESRSDQIKLEQMIGELPPAEPERTCVNCGRTVNNGGWYADGRTRCPIEEHYALPKDGYCHLWEKRNVTDDDYPERREDERPES